MQIRIDCKDHGLVHPAKFPDGTIWCQYCLFDLDEKKQQEEEKYKKKEVDHEQ